MFAVRSWLHVLVFGLIFAALPAAFADDRADRIKDAEAAIAAMKETDSSIGALMRSARGYAVFNTVGKAGMGIGGARGKGVLFEGGKPVGYTTLTQLTVGLQLGAQSYSEMIFFETEQAIRDFKTGNFALDAQASAVAAAAGVSVDAPYRNGVKVITMAKGGLMYEASVGGQKFGYKPF